METQQNETRQHLIKPAIAHVGYFNLHSDTSLNFQLNRWIQWLGDATALEEMQAIAIPSLLDRGRASAGIIIPPEFSRDLHRRGAKQFPLRSKIVRHKCRS